MSLAPSIPALRDLPGTSAQQRSARVISIACGRSGVGKTTIAANLALSLSKMHRRAMLVDCDPGPTDATRMMGVEGKALSAGTAADGGYLVPAET